MPHRRAPDSVVPGEAQAGVEAGRQDAPLLGRRLFGRVEGRAPAHLAVGLQRAQAQRDRQGRIDLEAIAVVGQDLALVEAAVGLGDTVVLVEVGVGIGDAEGVALLAVEERVRPGVEELAVQGRFAQDRALAVLLPEVDVPDVDAEPNGPSRETSRQRRDQRVRHALQDGVVAVEIVGVLQVVVASRRHPAEEPAARSRQPARRRQVALVAHRTGQVVEVDDVLIVARLLDLQAETAARAQRLVKAQPAAPAIVRERRLEVVGVDLVVPADAVGSALRGGLLAPDGLELEPALEASLREKGRHQGQVQVVARGPEQGQLDLSAVAAGEADARHQKPGLTLGLHGEDHGGEVEDGDAEGPEPEVLRHAVAADLQVGLGDVDLPGARAVRGLTATGREVRIRDVIAVDAGPLDGSAAHGQARALRVQGRSGGHGERRVQVERDELRGHLVGAVLDAHVARGDAHARLGVEGDPVREDLAPPGLHDADIAARLVDPALGLVDDLFRLERVAAPAIRSEQLDLRPCRQRGQQPQHQGKRKGPDEIHRTGVARADPDGQAGVPGERRR